MGIIKPTLSLTANSRAATTDAGPLSIALSLSATDSLDVTKVESKIMDLTAGSEADATHRVWDASTYTASAQTDQDGGFVYLKNILVDNSPVDRLHDILIGHKTGAEDLDGDGETDRLMTLRPGEFAWFPWDMAQDIIADIKETNTAALECWVFVRTGTA